MLRLLSFAFSRRRNGCDPIACRTEFSAAIDASFVQGLASVNNRLLILVDIELLMTSQGMQLVEQQKAVA